MHFDFWPFPLLKFRHLKIQDGGGRLLKNRKIAIILATVWAMTPKFGTVTNIDPLHPVGRWNSDVFEKPRWRTGAIFKIEKKTPYLSNGLTNHCEIWQGDAFWQGLAGYCWALPHISTFKITSLYPIWFTRYTCILFEAKHNKGSWALQGRQKAGGYGKNTCTCILFTYQHLLGAIWW